MLDVASLDRLIDGWLSVPDLAEQLGEPVTRVRQALREGRLVGVRRGNPPTLQVPAAFVHDRALLKGLAGTLTVLRDQGYNETEALRWLFSPDESLPGAPVHALIENRGAEVKRRAQALGF